MKMQQLENLVSWFSLTGLRLDELPDKIDYQGQQTIKNDKWPSNRISKK
jgi:hypothetical protein